MYTKEQFEKEKERVLKYILYQKRSEYEITNKFSKTIEQEMLLDIIQYLKEVGYINDTEFVKKTINQFMLLKNLSIKEIQYKLMTKGIDRNDIENYIEHNYEELEQYEINSASNIIAKKSNSMDEEKLKQYLLKKGYKYDSIQKAINNN